LASLSALAAAPAFLSAASLSALALFSPANLAARTASFYY